MNSKKPATPCLLFLLALLFFSTGCNDKTAVQTLDAVNPAFSNYISAYTSGVISRTEPIIIRLSSPAVKEGVVGQSVANGVLSFNPNLSGEATWEDPQTIKFTPSQMLPVGTVYKVNVGLGKIYNGLDQSLQSFAFNFTTREQFYSVDLNGLNTPDISDLSKQALSGSVRTADFADNSEVEKIISAKQKGNGSLNINWEHSADQQQHDFVIEPIKRGDQASELQLSWNGKSINVDKKGTKNLEVPMMGDFKITDAQVVQENEQYVLLQFSDPITKNQNLDGLVSIKGYSGDLRFVIDGNQVRVYPATRLQGARELTVTEAIKNTENYRMKEASKWFITFEDVKPQVRLVGRGVIIPNSEGLIFPFESVNLDAVDVEIFKVYGSNIIQFLQVNELAGDYQLSRVGKVVYQKKVPLKDLNPEATYFKWERYALDLSDLVDADPSAIYQVRIGFQKSYSTYFCTQSVDDEGIQDNYYDRTAYQEDDIRSFFDYNYRYWRYEGYEWDHRNDPCYPPYYGVHNFVGRNVVASDLGLIAKRGEDGTISVAVSDLITAQPVAGTKLEFYDYQQQLIGDITSDGQGMATIQLDRKPFVLIAKSANGRGYLKMDDGSSVSLSRFDVSGARPQKGLKGYIYGERGVWRPGDSLYLTFVLEDKKQTLPMGHPISLEFYDARGNLQEKRSAETNAFQMYPFHLSTAEDDPTGNWQVKVKVGGATFSKQIRIETVKPNRLKVKLDFGTEELVASGDLNGSLQVNWLHGAPAQNLRTQIDYQVRSINTTFPKYKTFEFDDPARRFSSSPQTLFNGNVDENGQATISGDLNVRKAAPGKMKVNFAIRAFEKGGDFSSDNFSMNYSPYEQYAGIAIPTNKWGSKRFEINQDNKLQVILVDKDGNPLANKNISVGIYKVKWRWWWENSRDNVTSSFSSDTHYGSIKKEILSTNSKGEANWTVKPDDWGRYLIRVCDPESGHCSGDYVYAGYPWYGDDDAGKKAAAILAFNSDKTTYQVGETVKLNIPSSQQGKALISIENGSRVIESYWTDLKDGETTFQFYASEEMTPTVYAHVSLIQPHAQTENDMPIRMYGVIPIKVEDPNTKLEPEIKMADVLRPEKKFTVEVSEKSKKGMSYTLAVVDEGLLDLTRFSTPDPWNTFYAREALGVKTWDVYDFVLGAYGGELERILSIGGDGESGPKGGQKANRFKPVVQHLGPFYLKPGQKAKHEIEMPNYIGSVRTMVVASNTDGAYGKTDKTTPVRNPLMVLATLPRVLGPGEIVELPVNVFAMEDKVKNVDIKVEVNDKLELLGPSTKNVRFNKIGDEMVYFRMRVKEGLGVATVKVSGNGNGEKASQEIELDVRNPNPYITDVLQAVLQPGQDWEQAFNLPGMAGTNTATLEISTFPPIDLGRRLRYLVRYPHGCIEQTTSGAFPQLFLSKLVQLSEEQKNKTQDNIRAGLNRIQNFQTASGGFGYWPGDNAVNAWGSSYAGHFMLEAKNMGYTLPPNMLDRWKANQRKTARNWTAITNKNDYRYRNDALMQAYRLYTLALAGSPELGAMNRLRERPNLPKTAKWSLAAAYAMAGKTDVAKALVKDIDTKVGKYQELGYSYGSSLRDQAMILETLILIGDKTTSAELAREIADDLSSNSWHSTQTIAYSLLGIGKFLGDNPTQQNLQFEYAVASESMKNAGANTPIVQIDLNAESIGNSRIKVKNTSNGVLYGRLILQGQPLVGDSTSSESKLKMKVNYRSTDGKSIDPTSVKQGTDFIAEVTITNPGQFGYYEEMALSQIFPSGWEIRNTRLNNVNLTTTASRAEYQDFRDDRVYSYFDIGAGQSQTYQVQINAAYTGRYYLPTISCEAMYDNTINARDAGQWVEVIAPEGVIQ